MLAAPMIYRDSLGAASMRPYVLNLLDVDWHQWALPSLHPARHKKIPA